MGVAAILPAISIGSSILGTIGKVQGARAEAQSQRDLGVYQRQVAENNAIVTLQNARRAARRTGEAVSDEARAGNKFSSRQITQLAANGVVVDSGSALDLVRDADDQTRRNIRRLRQQGVDEQGAFVAQAHNLRQGGQLAQVTAENKARAAGAKAGQALVSGVGTVAGKWFGFAKELGAFDTDPSDIGNILTLSHNADPDLT